MVTYIQDCYYIENGDCFWRFYFIYSNQSFKIDFWVAHMGTKRIVAPWRATGPQAMLGKQMFGKLFGSRPLLT